MLVLDFETKSELPIDAGTDRYASHPTTDIICLGWRTLSMPKAKVWFPVEPIPKQLLDVLNDPQTQVYAHHAAFDQAIYEYVGVGYGLPALKAEQWHCSAAEARVNGLAASLDNAYRHMLNNPRAIGKDFRGTQLIKECSIPPFNTDPVLLKEMGEYCARDVDITLELVMGMAPLVTKEWGNETAMGKAIDAGNAQCD